MPTLASYIPTPTARVGRIARTVALVVGGAVLTALFAQIRVVLPFTPVPITGQTLSVLLVGTVLGWQRGMLSQLLYWVAGVFMPIPWYANDTTGASITEGWNVAVGPTAGYLAGFVLAAGAVGYLAERGQDRSLATSIPAMLAGTAVIYVCGAVWLAYSLNIPIANGETNALALGVVPFLVGDMIKMLIAGLAAPAAWLAVRR